MSIFADKQTTLIVQGITGRDGSFHAKQMIEYGTRVVAGVTPGKGGQKFENKVPIFNTMHDAVQKTGANASITIRIALTKCFTIQFPVYFQRHNSPSIPTLPLKARKSCLIVKNFTSVFLEKINNLSTENDAPRTFIIPEEPGIYGHFNGPG